MASQRNSSEPPGEGVGRPRRQLGPLRLLRRGQRGVKATASAVPVVEVQANVSRLTGEERCVSPVILSTAAGAAPPHPTQPRATSPNAAVVAPVVAPAHPSVSANTSSPATGGAAAVRSALPASKGLRGRRSSVVSRVSTVARSVAARASTYSRESRWDSSILKIRRDRTRAMEAATSVLSPASQQHLTKMKLARVRAAKKEGPPEPVVAQAPSSHKVSTEVHSKLTRIRAAKLAASVSRQLRSHRSSTRDSTARTSMFRQSRRDAPRSSHRQGKARARFDPTLTAQSELPTCHESNAASTLYAGRNAAMGAGARGPPQAERRGRGLAGRRTRESGLVVDRATDCSEGWLSMRNPRESGLTVDRRTDLSDSALATDVSRRHRESGLVVDRRTGDEERGHRCRPTAGRATARDSDLSVDAPSGRRETGLAVDAHPGAARRHWRGRSITHRQGGTPFDGIARVSSQDELSTPPRVTFRLDSDKVESPWMQLGLELAGLELIAEEEASLDAQSKALMLAGRVRQPSASGIAKSTWLDFGQELARLSLSHEEEAALDGQSKASLRAARKLGERISRQSDSGGASWMGFGLELAELELTEEEEAELDAQSKASLRAARVVGRRESIRKSVAPSVSWMEFGLELAELDLTEEEEAELDAQSKASLRAARVVSRRKNSRKSVAPSVSWMGFGLELAELDLTEEEEVELDAQSRASLRAARVVSRRKNSRKSVAPSVSWMGFGLELAELDLTEEEEVELDAQSKASLHAARIVGRRKSSRKSVAADSSWVGFGLELAELDLTEEEEVELDAQSKASLRAARVVKRRESCRPSTTSASWVEFGLELADLDLDAEEEAALDAQSKASLRAARVVGRRESCRESVSASASWVEFGLELADLELDGEEEAALDAQSKASLRAARVVGRRESCRKSVAASASWLDFGIELADLELTREQEASLDAQSRASLRAARVVGRRESCRRSCAGNPSWPGFQMDQTELGFIEEESSMKEHSRTPLKLATDASQLQHPSASAWNDFGMQEGLELSEEETAASAQAHAVTRANAHDIAPATSWLGFGLELAALGLSADEEAALDAQARAALQSARVVKARGEPPESMVKSAWVGFGLELAALGLSADEEGALDAQAQAALHSARVVKARGEPPEVGTVKSSWVGFGLELAGLGLNADEEEALDAQARTALRSARIIKARGELPEGMVKSSWLGFGLELAGLGLNADEEEALDAQARAALLSARLLKAKLISQGHRISVSSHAKWHQQGSSPVKAEKNSTPDVREPDTSRRTSSSIKEHEERCSMSIKEHEERCSMSGAAGAPIQGADPRCRSSSTHMEPAITAPSIMHGELHLGSSRATCGGVQIDRGAQLSIHVRAAPTDMMHEAAQRVKQPSVAASSCSSVLTTGVHGRPETTRIGESLDSIGEVDSEDEEVVFECDGSQIRESHAIADPRVSSGAISHGLDYIEARSSHAAPPGAALSTVHARAVQGRPSLPVGASLDESIGEIDLEDEQVTFGSACTSSPRSTSLAEGLSMSAQTAVPTPSSAVTLGGTAEVIPGSSISSQGMSLEIEDGADAPSHDGAPSGEQTILESAADAAPQSSSREALDRINSQAQDVACLSEGGSAVHARAVQGWPPLPVGASLDESIGEVDSEDEQVTFGSACTASQRSTSLAEGVSMPAQAAAPSPSSAVTLSGTAEVMPGSCISSQDTPFHIQCGADAPSHDGAPSGEQAILASAADDIDPQTAVEESPNYTQNVDVRAPSPDVASPMDELGSISAVYASVVNGPSGALMGTTSMSDSISRVMEHEITFSDSDSRPLTSCCEDYPPAAAPSSAVLEGQSHTFSDLALSRVVLSQEILTPESVIDVSAAVTEHAAYVPPFGQRDISSPSLVVPDKGSASKGRQGGFNEQEKVALVRHVKWALKNNPLVADIEKIDPHSNDIYQIIAASVLPCLFIHHVDELAIDVRALNVPGDQPLDQSSRLQNHTLCINAATSIGCGVRGLRPQHLDNAAHHSHAVLQLLWNLTKYELLRPLRGDRSAFSNFMLPEESMHTFVEVSATELLRRWLTSRIQGYIRSHPQQLLVSSNFVVSDFGTDLADSIALAIVLKQLSSASTRPDELRKYRIEQRAACVVDAARDAGVEAFQVEAEDITSAQPRLLLAFVAAIYHKFPRAQSTKNKKVDGGREEREERSLRFWMISIGISIQSLPLDCRTGVPLLQAIELLKPGTVNWRKAYGNPTSVFHCVENCNQACDLCTRALALSMVGIGGKDIADGKRKLILAIVWQLMRLHTLKFLRELGADEAGILDWANDRVRHVDGLQYICGFSDPLIGKGVFLLHLLHSVAPECVSPDKILAGETAEECQLNARYAISCAHKMGCTLFAVWEDVVEVLPKMVMVLLAAVMKVDMVRCGTIEPDAHGLLSDSDLLYNTRPSRELSFERVEHRGDDSIPGGSVPSNPFVVRLQAPTCVPPPPPAPLELLDEPSAEVEAHSVYPCEQLEAECASPSCSSAPQPASEDPTSPGVTSPSRSAPFTIRVARPLQELPELGSPSLELPGPSSPEPSPTSTAPLSQRIRPADRTESFRRGGRPAPSPPGLPASVGLSSPASEAPVSRDPPSVSDFPASGVLLSPNASDPESSRPAARVAHFATSCPSKYSAALPESADHETQELQDGVTQPGYWSAHSQSPTGKSTSRATRSFFSRFGGKSNNRRLRFAVRRKKPHDAAYASFLRDGAMDNLSGSTSVTAEVPTGAAAGYKECSVPYDPILGSWHSPAPRNNVNPQQLLQVGRRMRFLSQIHRFSSTPQLYHASLDTESRTL